MPDSNSTHIHTLHISILRPSFPAKKTGQVPEKCGTGSETDPYISVRLCLL